MEEGIVIFGASSGALKVAKMLNCIGLDFEFFVDNNIRKHGELLYGKLIRNPEVLIRIQHKYKIIIASMYYEEIENQLIQLGIKKENIVLAEKYSLEYIVSHKEQMINELPFICNSSTNINILVDLAEGISLGGIERWGLDFSNSLYKCNKKVTILSKIINKEAATNILCELVEFDLSYDRYIESIKEIVNEIINKLPCTIINNRINQVFMAAYIVKSYYPNKIKIISVIHSDFIRMYKQNELCHEFIDKYVCVSEDVKNKFVNNFMISKDKVYYKDSPIFFENNYKKIYSKNHMPLVIGYGARLEKVQKRSDLLIPLIHLLETNNVNYKLYIAGDGCVYGQIEKYIHEYSLIDKVKLYGLIPFDKMNDFWKMCDVFINLSEIEGIGLSMLEAMSLGVVPVVTDTAGAASFIKSGVNGFINNIGDIDGIVNCIKLLSDNREMLSEFGMKSRDVIKQKCNTKDYIEFWDEFILN